MSILERRDETECTKGRRYKKYDENTLDQALRQILNGMSVGTAAKKFGVPVRTIYRQCRKKNVKPTRGSKKDVDESGGSGNFIALFQSLSLIDYCDNAAFFFYHRDRNR